MKNSETNNYQERAELCQKIFDGVHIPIYCKSADGKIKTCNKAFTNIIGLKKEEISGKKIIDIVNQEQADALLFKDSDTLNNGNDQFYETKLQYADKSIREVIINKSAIRDKNEKVTDIISSIIDISERNKIKNKLIKAEEESMISSTMLKKIRAGIVIVDKNMKIINSNIVFAQMFEEDNQELFETVPGLTGAELDMIAPKFIFDLIHSIIETGENRIERDFKFQNKLLSVNVITILRNKVAGAIIRNLSEPMLERSEIIERARQVNRKNMKTVQEIAFLLGENAAQTEELLNSIIESQKYDIEKKEIK